MRRTPYGHRQGTMVNGVWTPTASTLPSRAALAALDPFERVAGDIMVVADGSQWIYSATSAAVDPTQNLVLTPPDGKGAWLRIDEVVDLSISLDFTVADAAVLFTVPVGCRLMVRRGYWEVVTAFTGGNQSALGLSSTNPNFGTKGDVLGGATGDVAATLVPGFQLGTIGAKTAGGVLLTAGNAIRFDRIASAFAAGAGNAHLVCDVLANVGA
jgi:hypothetical protein